MQREDRPAITTGLKRIAARATAEPEPRFTSSLASGVDGQSVSKAKEEINTWIQPMLSLFAERNVSRKKSWLSECHGLIQQHFGILRKLKP